MTFAGYASSLMRAMEWPAITAPAVLGAAAGLAPLPLDVVPMYFELDGTFPNHEANPIDPATLVALQRKVLEVGADLGLAFDGDADRCFVVDEKGNLVSPSVITALIAQRELQRVPGAAVIHNLITSRVVAETIIAHGGRPIRTRVGHSFIKARMAETDAVFGGEHSGHFYFADFWRADSGMLAALHVLAALGQDTAGQSLSELLSPYSNYVSSGEVNSTVLEAAAATEVVRAPLRASARHHDGRSRRSHRRIAGLVVQPSIEQHRATIAT